MQVSSINIKTGFYSKSFQAQRASNVSFGKNNPESEAAGKDMKEVSNIIQEYCEKNKINVDENSEKFSIKIAEDLPDILGESIGVIEQRLEEYSGGRAKQLRYLEMVSIQTDNIAEGRKNIDNVDFDIARGVMSFFYSYVNSLYNQKLEEIRQ